MEEGVRFSSEEKNIYLKDDISDALLLVELLINPILELLQQKPTACGSKLGRIVVDSTSGRKSRVITAVDKLLESKFEPAVEVILKLDIVRYTAELVLYRYKDSSRRENYSAYSTSLRLRLESQILMDLSLLSFRRKHNTIPSRKTAVLTTSEDNQTTATICVVAGLAPRVRDNFLPTCPHVRKVSHEFKKNFVQRTIEN